MSKSPCFVAEIDISLASKLKEDLISQGFEVTTPQYTLLQAKKTGVSCTLYSSGKLTVQGKNKDEFITLYLEPEILGNLSYSYPETEQNLTPHIGVDEAGKGDVFGPLCVGAVYADENSIKELTKMGIRDSKRMKDSVIIKLAKQVQEKLPYSLIKIFPRKYNELYDKFRNLNSLLGWGHATSIEELVQKTGCQHVTIDKFANESVVESAVRRKGLDLNLTQRHRGEEDVVVAAASIIARAAFVQGMERLSSEYEIVLPKGASPAVKEAGRRFVAKHGRQALNEIAKMHFKTVDEIIQC